MAYVIQPNTTIRVCSGVPLSNSYQDTIWFDTASAQRTYFGGKVTHTYGAQSYQRHGLGVLRVAANPDTLAGVNYLMFQNTSFGNRWFYAFVTQVNYVNNKTTELVYEIDVMQTYLFDVTLKPCFVEREHVSDDTFGKHTLPEPIDCSNYHCYSYLEQDWSGECSIYLWLAEGTS